MRKSLAVSAALMNTNIHKFFKNEENNHDNNTCPEYR